MEAVFVERRVPFKCSGIQVELSALFPKRLSWFSWHFLSQPLCSRYIQWGGGREEENKELRQMTVTAVDTCSFHPHEQDSFSPTPHQPLKDAQDARARRALPGTLVNKSPFHFVDRDLSELRDWLTAALQFINGSAKNSKSGFSAHAGLFWSQIPRAYLWRLFSCPQLPERSLGQGLHGESKGSRQIWFLQPVNLGNAK